MSANAVAANEGPVAISFEQTWADVLEVNRTLPKMRWAGWMMGIVGGGIIVTGFVVLARGTPSAAPLFLWGSVFMLIGMLSGRVAAWGVWWREGNARLSAEISDNGMRWWTEDVDKSLRMSWDEFDHVYETDRLIVVNRGSDESCSHDPDAGTDG